MQTKNTWNGPLLLIAGAAVGYTLGLIASPQMRRKQKRALMEVSDRIDWDMLSQKIFGRSSKETKQMLQSYVTDFEDRIEAIKDEMEQLNPGKYQELVGDFVSQLEDQKSLTRTQIKKLSDYLRSDYERITLQKMGQDDKE